MLASNWNNSVHTRTASELLSFKLLGSPSIAAELCETVLTSQVIRRTHSTMLQSLHNAGLQQSQSLRLPKHAASCNIQICRGGSS